MVARRSLALLVWISACWLSGPAAADTVVLKNGARYDGLIKQQSSDQVTILADGTEWTFRSDKIASVTKDAASARTAAAEELDRARRLAEDVPPVVMYSTHWCGVCRKARAYFRDRNIRFIDNDIEADQRARGEMRAKCLANHLRPGGVPVIDVRGHVMVGFSEAFIRRYLKKRGD